MEADFVADARPIAGNALIAQELPRLQGRARVALGLLLCQVPLSVIDGATYWFVFGHPTTARGEFRALGVAATMLSGCLGPLVTIATIVAFCVWLHAAVSRVRATAADARFSAAWSVGCWFVPVVNLWLPFVAVRHLWLLSAHGEAWRGRSPSPWITAWWASLLLSNLLDLSGFATAAWPQFRDTATYVALVGCALDGAAALLAARLVKEITELQADRLGRA